MVTRDKVFKLTTYVSMCVLIYIIILSVFICATKMLNLPSFLILFVVLLISIIILFSFAFIKKIKLFKNKFTFIIFTTLLTALPRLVWILFIDTQPVSDFGLYHSYALHASKGIYNLYHYTYPLFPFKFGYPIILSILYRVFGAKLVTGLAFNIIISIGISLSIYWIGSMIFNKQAGQFSSIIFALWIAQIMYSSVLASEHIFILLLLVVAGLFVQLKNRIINAKDVKLLSVSIGIILAAAHFVRPVSFMVLLVFFVFLFVNTKGTFAQDLVKKLKIQFLIVLAFVISFAIITLPLSKLIGVPIWRSSSGFSILTGTNFTSGGAYNTADEEIIKEYQCDFDKVHSAALSRAFDRIRTYPLQFLRLIEKKYIILWSNENFGLYWSTIQVRSPSEAYNFIINNPLKVKCISQLYYIIILIFAAAGLMYSYRSNIQESIVLSLILLSFFAAHTFLEVQSRYHMPVIPFLMLYAGYYCDRLTDRIFRYL